MIGMSAAVIFARGAASTLMAAYPRRVAMTEELGQLLSSSAAMETAVQTRADGCLTGRYHAPTLSRKNCWNCTRHCGHGDAPHFAAWRNTPEVVASTGGNHVDISEVCEPEHDF